MFQPREVCVDPDLAGGELELEDDVFVKPLNHMLQSDSHRVIPCVCRFLADNPWLDSRPTYDGEPNEIIYLGPTYDQEINENMEEEIVEPFFAENQTKKVGLIFSSSTLQVLYPILLLRPYWGECILVIVHTNEIFKNIF